MSHLSVSYCRPRARHATVEALEYCAVLYMLEIEVYNLRKQKAEDRYQFILKHFPNLLQRVPLKYLATYLGVNLETLSGIRAKRSKIGD